MDPPSTLPAWRMRSEDEDGAWTNGGWSHPFDCASLAWFLAGKTMPPATNFEAWRAWREREKSFPGYSADSDYEDEDDDLDEDELGQHRDVRVEDLVPEVWETPDLELWLTLDDRDVLLPASVRSNPISTPLSPPRGAPSSSSGDGRRSRPLGPHLCRGGRAR